MLREVAAVAGDGAVAEVGCGLRVGARYCAGYVAPVGACEGGSMSTEGLEKQAMAEGMKEHAELVKYRQALEGIIDVTHMMVEIARKALAE